MKYKYFTVVLLAILTLSGCASVREIPDKTPCTGFIKTNGDCIGKPINTNGREV